MRQPYIDLFQSSSAYPYYKITIQQQQRQQQHSTHILPSDIKLRKIIRSKEHKGRYSGGIICKIL